LQNIMVCASHPHAVALSSLMLESTHSRCY